MTTAPDRFADPLALCPPEYAMVWREVNEQLAKDGHAPAVVPLIGGPFAGTLAFTPGLDGPYLIVRQQSDMQGHERYDLQTPFAVEAQYSYRTEPCPGHPDSDPHVVEVSYDSERTVTLGEAIEEGREQHVALLASIQDHIARIDAGLDALRSGLTHAEAVAAHVIHAPDDTDLTVEDVIGDH